MKIKIEGDNKLLKRVKLVEDVDYDNIVVAYIQGGRLLLINSKIDKEELINSINKIDSKLLYN